MLVPYLPRLISGPMHSYAALGFPNRGPLLQADYMCFLHSCTTSAWYRPAEVGLAEDGSLQVLQYLPCSGTLTFLDSSRKQALPALIHHIRDFGQSASQRAMVTEGHDIVHACGQLVTVTFGD